MKYTLDTSSYIQFFDYKNTFHFPTESGSITYLSETSSKEVIIYPELIDNSDLREGTDEEAVFLYIPEISGPVFYCSRVPMSIEE